MPAPLPDVLADISVALPQDGSAPQRIIKIRRDYNTWVADETLEDYALRYTPKTMRKWSEFRVANTAFGAVSFLAMEAIGASIALNYGFMNAFVAICVVCLIIFLTSLPISYYAARYGVDMDLLTRGAGFGYIGSTLTSLIYSSFTFIFFAIEAAIMALALELFTGLPLYLGYLVSSLVIIPVVLRGITLINKLQAWTQPIWLILLILPYAALLYQQPTIIQDTLNFSGKFGQAPEFNVLLFGAACTVIFALVAQVGEQVDYLRFLPAKTSQNRKRWYGALFTAGPGWIVFGMFKIFGGVLLAVLALQHFVPLDKASDPTQLYLIAYQYVFAQPEVALAFTALFVVISQIKINVTNAYAGSLAWSNFFARLTHSHPGRVVWLVFNVLIAVLLMELGVFHALEQVLGLYANVAIAWIAALVADLVINKPLGLSPKGIEFRRAYLYDINPVGVGAMLIASVLSITAYSGVFGELPKALASFIALTTSFICVPLIAWLTKSKYYIARQPTVFYQELQGCCICEKKYEKEDMAYCPAYQDAICSLCCSLDARCHDLCKPEARLSSQLLAIAQKILPTSWSTRINTRLSYYLLLVLILTVLLGASLGLIYFQEILVLQDFNSDSKTSLALIFIKIFTILFLLICVASWWLVLTYESRRVAQEESNRQTTLLVQEIDAHRITDQQLQQAQQVAERANQAKSRYVTGISHELRTPLNSILGYSQLITKDNGLSLQSKTHLNIIHRSGAHLISLIDGLLDLARIETGKLTLVPTEINLPEFLNYLADMFRPQATDKGIDFICNFSEHLPQYIRSDKKRLDQILINIIGNAVKFTQRGKVTFKVSYRYQTATFEIDDSGCGITPEDLPNIFNPFERGGNTPAHAIAGTGLGLTIAKLLTDLLGGEINVRSQVGVGSTFQIRLYLPEVQSPKPISFNIIHQITGYHGPRHKILLVDNEELDRQLLWQFLQPLGFELAEADSGLACLRLVPEFQPDLIIMDLTMPHLSGWETASILRNNHLTLAPILIVSANAEEQGKSNDAQIERDDFIVKPVDLLRLLERIGQRLNLHWIKPQQGSPASAITSSMPATPALDGKTASQHAGNKNLIIKNPLSLADRQALLQLVNMGYVRGITSKLDEIAHRQPEHATAIQHLKTLTSQFDLKALQAHLQQEQWP
jgi:signal transduction histidine kinase/CheY-like chemotaxis protein/purine-cytosine permease-like protein